MLGLHFVLELVVEDEDDFVRYLAAVYFLEGFVAISNGFLKEVYINVSVLGLYLCFELIDFCKIEKIVKSFLNLVNILNKAKLAIISNSL